MARLLVHVSVGVFGDTLIEMWTWSSRSFSFLDELSAHRFLVKG